MLCGTDEKKMVCDEASTVGDHKDSRKVGGFNPLVILLKLSSVACSITSQKQATLDFCVVRDWSATLESEKIKKNSHLCVSNRQNGRLIFHARYGNCYEGSNPNTAHRC